MQWIPLAIGQSEQTLILWEPTPEIAVAFPRSLQTVSEVKWGAGTLDDESCLILYLFVGLQALEIYLPEQLPTSPQNEIAVWSTIWEWKPTLLKMRYGFSPINKSDEITFLLPKYAGESINDKYFEFVNLMRKQMREGALDQRGIELLERLSFVHDEISQEARELNLKGEE